MPIRAVCFDVGETLIDETREWNGWADFLGVPRLTLFTALGVSMWRGESHRKVFEIFRPDLDFATVRQQRAAHGLALWVRTLGSVSRRAPLPERTARTRL